MPEVSIPIEFRSEIIQPVLKTLIAGESCSLVGVGSSGKSNVARHLERYDVRAYHLGERAQTTLSALADCTKLTDYSSRSLHSLILEATLRGTQQAGPNVIALRPQLETMWEQAAEIASPDRARHMLEDAVAIVLRAGVTHVVVILDDFDPVVKSAPAPVLNGLRALRDDYKARLMYVTVTRRELAFLRDEDEFKDFHEIVSTTTIAIGPYREADANLMIDRLVARWGLSHSLNEAERLRLLEVSGRHAGLIRAILRVTHREDAVDLLSPDLVERLRGHPRVEPECDEIWKSLEDEETADLQSLVSRGWPLGAATRRLERKGLIRQRLDGGYEIFSPVFADYVLNTLPGGRFAIELVPARQEILMPGRAIKNLDTVEYRLFTCLHKRRGQPVTRQELIREMISAEANQRRFSGPPDQRLDSYMSEVKHKVDSDQREYVICEPDGCYRLIGLDGK